MKLNNNQLPPLLPERGHSPKSEMAYHCAKLSAYRQYNGKDSNSLIKCNKCSRTIVDAVYCGDCYNKERA